MKKKKEIAIKTLKSDKQINILKREYFYMKKLQGKHFSLNC